MKLALYCACGGSMTGTISPTAEAGAIEAMFRRGHDTPECSPSDARGARNARRRQERAFWLGEGSAS
jgi:hypothetical protein